MTITVTLGTWISHDNMLLSAALYHGHKTGIPVAFHCEAASKLPLATFVVEHAGRRVFLDYNDTFELEPLGATMDAYGKRSLTAADAALGIFPLGFHFNYSFGLHRLLRHPGFLARRNRVEIARAIDVLAITGWSHFARRVQDIFVPPVDHGGRVIFYSRLWDPDSNDDPEEQERRRRMNHVRIEVVRTLRKMGNTAAGIMPTEFARRTCPDVLLDERETHSKHYGRALRDADIGIANEGLRGSPGWKIGEYVAGSKAVVSNAITSVTPEFEAGRNYVLFDDPLAIPELVAQLRRGGAYRAMQMANWDYCRRYLHPDRYLARILEHGL